jgi:serine protease Do
MWNVEFPPFRKSGSDKVKLEKKGERTMNATPDLSNQVRKHVSRNLMLGVALLGLACVAVGTVSVKAVPKEDAAPGIAHLQETAKAFASVTKQVTPAVLAIKVEKKVPAGHPLMGGNDLRQQIPDDWLREFFGNRVPRLEMPERPRGERRATGQGSGFILREDGYILTNNHVVEGASKLTVTLADGRELDARVIGTDPQSDVAVIKVDAKDLPTLPTGNSDEVEVGEWVLAIGSPFGLPGTVTSGIVSATGRNSVGIADYENFIQTDAAINPGNSGGPLVNLKGEVVGINTAIASRTGAYNGIGFAIPINMARDICDQLIAGGSVSRGHLGIIIQKLTPTLAQSFGVEISGGVLIGDVANGSPAEKAGLKPGDVIVEFAGKPVKDLGAFRNSVAARDPGSKVEMSVLRDDERKTLTIQLGQTPTSSKETEATAKSDTVESLGFAVQPLTDDVRERLNWKSERGVVVSHVQAGSQAAAAGIRPGMLIEEVNRTKVTSVDEFRRLMKDAKESDNLLLRVKQGEFSQYIALSTQTD